MKTSTIALSLFAVVGLAAPEAYGNNKGKNDRWGKDRFSDFTSTWEIKATPDQVVNGTTPTGGLPGARGTYKFGINSKKNYICYDIELEGFGTSLYQSPADTATHVHEALKGQSGPPRLAFPNPAYEGCPEKRISRGCLQAPFQTGINASGVDTGKGFHVAQIEKEPWKFFADVHTNTAVAGAVRGQFA